MNTFPSGWKTRVRTPCPLLAPCNQCKELLPVCNFYSVKRGRKTILGRSIANTCPTCSIENYKRIDPRLKLLYGAKQRANQFGLEFSLTIDDIVIPDICPIRGVKITDGTGSGSRNSSLNFDSPSLDRINNQLGYTPQNVRVISRRANLVKSNTSPYEATQIMIYMVNNRHVLDPSDLALLKDLRDLLNSLNLDTTPVEETND